MSERVVVAGHGFTLHLIVLIMTFALPARAADTPRPAAGENRIVKLLAISTGYSAAGTTTYLQVAPADGGAPTKMVVTEDARKKLGPLYNQRGELISITVRPAGGVGSDVVTAAAPFDGPKAFKSPRAFTFEGLSEQKVGVQTFTTAKLSRLGQTREVFIPNRTAPGQKPAPDPTLLDRLKNTRQGDVIEIDVAPGPSRGAFTLTDVDAYREPQVADFVKLETIKEGTKSYPAVTLNVDDQSKTFALPAPAPGVPLSPAAAAVQTLAKKLKPGYAVRFIARDDGPRPTLRELRIDGEMQGSTDNDYNLVSTYVRVHFSGRPPDPYVYFYPATSRPNDLDLDRGVSRVLFSGVESGRLKINKAQLQQLKAAHATRPDTQDVTVTPGEKMQWTKAYNAWHNATDDATRTRVEQDMLWAAQELSQRWKKEIESKYTILRSILTPEQLEEVMKLGKKYGTSTTAD